MNQKGQVPKSKSLPNGLFEALRDLGGGINSNIQKQTGFRPGKDFLPQEGPDTEYQSFYERQLRQVQVIRKEERLIFSAKEQETKVHVTVLQEEIKKLTAATTNLAKEAQVAAFKAPVQPGVYHENFFERLISFVKSLTKKIEDASSWLAIFNRKSQKKPYYWAQVKKSGTKFMLSPDRYMSTQSG